jgi:hypothetical protein
MSKEYADASISGLCSAASTTLSLSVAFLGIWAFAESGMGVPWKKYDGLLVFVAFVAFGCLAYTPYHATGPKDPQTPLKPLTRAREIFLAGLVLDLLWIAIALIQTF